MNDICPRSFLALGAAFALAATGLCQAPYTVGDPQSLSLPGAPNGIVTGHFTRLGYADPIFAIDGELHMLSTPVMRQSLTATGITPTAYAVGRTNFEDVLLTVDGDGLKEWRLSTSGSGANWNSTTIESIDFAGASMLAVGESNGDGAYDVAAVSADGMQVKVLRSTGGVTTAVGLFPPMLSAQALLFFDLDGDGLDELAVATNLGLLVLASDLQTILINDTRVSDESRLVAAPAANQTNGSLLAWAHWTSNNGAGIRVIEASGNGYDVTLGPGAPVRSLAAGRAYQTAPFADLFYQRDSDHQVYVLRNLPGAPHYLTMASSTLAMYAPQQAGTGNDRIAVRDFDGDGDDDVFAIAANPGGWRLATNRAVHADDLRIIPVQPTELRVPSSPDKRSFIVPFITEVGEESPLTAGLDATHVQVRIWRAEVDGTRASHMNVSGVAESFQMQGGLEAPLGQPMALDLDRYHFDHHGFLVVVRAIKRDGQGNLLRVLPPSVSIWAHQDSEFGTESPLVEHALLLPGVDIEALRHMYEEPIYPGTALLEGAGLWLLRHYVARQPLLPMLAAVSAALPMWSGKSTGVEVPLPPAPPLPPDVEDDDDPPASDDDQPREGG